MNFITQNELDQIIGSHHTTEHKVELLNEVLSRVLNKAVELALQMTPELTAQMVKNTAAIRKLTDAFLDNNKFREHKDIAFAVVRQIEIANPGKTYGEILDMAAPEIHRQIAALSKQLSLPTGGSHGNRQT